MDLTRSTRMNVVDLLSRLSKDAKQATPAMVRALRDEDHSMRQIAITFFTWGEDENCLLNQMEPGAKRDVLPEFIRAMQDPNADLRNNAAIALRYYPEEAKVVVPILTKALQDPVPKVRQLAADALKRSGKTLNATTGWFHCLRTPHAVQKGELYESRGSIFCQWRGKIRDSCNSSFREWAGHRAFLRFNTRRFAGARYTGIYYAYKLAFPSVSGCPIGPGVTHDAHRVGHGGSRGQLDSVAGTSASGF
jgi:hypothetical protein